MALRLLRRFLPKANVAEALEDACRKAAESPREVQIDALRAVIFSDHHRGKGDGADDFARCEEAYCAALGWYHEQEYELWLLGDVEELWENRANDVLSRYGRVLELEKRFGPGLVRFFGNHDLEWSDPERVRKLLAGSLPPDTPVHEAMNVDLYDGPERLGTLFLVHGHQGTPDAGSALSRFVSRFAVRNVWGVAQRMLKVATTPPSKSVSLRYAHDTAMATWADERDDAVVLIAGHTHRPVFPDQPPPDLAEALAEAQRAYDAVAGSGGEAAAQARAALELAQTKFDRDEGHKPVVQKRPAYFNTGCCSFADGDVTGLVIENGRIGLVRWLDNNGDPRPQRLVEPVDLREILRRVAGRPPEVPSPSPAGAA